MYGLLGVFLTVTCKNEVTQVLCTTHKVHSANSEPLPRRQGTIQITIHMASQYLKNKHY